MVIFGEQIVGVRCDGAVGKDVVIGIGGDDTKLECGRNAEEVFAGELGQVHEPRQLAPSDRAAQACEDLFVFEKNGSGYGLGPGSYNSFAARFGASL